ncbi:MAG TPA: glycosyltransferase family 2 protein [Gemmatimonadaceae bacterium]|nr:glycosyltransferase family 2 protein [Gemmatimonadaceae bacterium]
MIEVSVVMPCLNEAETVGECVARARAALSAHGIDGEVLVADNGSTDGSQAIATAAGARVVPVTARGYGNALMGGIAAAEGKYVVMGDADMSYDFGELPRFLTKLRNGDELVQGCRLESGGGTVLPGAMPPLHRFWGNPMFSWMARVWFRAPIHDVHCGLRGFSTDLYRRLDLTCTGMEFASEMVIKASLARARISEVPITLHPDGRKGRKPHLRTFRDGWRHLSFYLIYSPRWLFLAPGLALVLLGLLGYIVAMPGMQINGVTFDVSTLLFASLGFIAGYQSIVFAILTKVFAIVEGLLPPDPRIDRFVRIVELERGLIIGVLTGTTGIVLLLIAIWQWRDTGFGPLNYEVTLRWVIPGVTLAVLGLQTILASFYLRILQLGRRHQTRY